MIDGEPLVGAAILAAVTVAREAARRLMRRGVPRGTWTYSCQLDDVRDEMMLVLGAKDALGVLERLGLLFEEKDECAPTR